MLTFPNFPVTFREARVAFEALSILEAFRTDGRYADSVQEVRPNIFQVLVMVNGQGYGVELRYYPDPEEMTYELRELHVHDKGIHKPGVNPDRARYNRAVQALRTAYSELDVLIMEGPYDNDLIEANTFVARALVMLDEQVPVEL